MPECQCGNPVSERYLRVFAPPDFEEEGKVRACPKCATVRERGDVRKARSYGAAYQEGEIQ